MAEGGLGDGDRCQRQWREIGPQRLMPIDECEDLSDGLARLIGPSTAGPCLGQGNVGQDTRPCQLVGREELVGRSLLLPRLIGLHPAPAPGCYEPDPGRRPQGAGDVAPSCLGHPDVHEGKSMLAFHREDFGLRLSALNISDLRESVGRELEQVDPAVLFPDLPGSLDGPLE